MGYPCTIKQLLRLIACRKISSDLDATWDVERAASLVPQPRFKRLTKVDLRDINLGPVGSPPDLLVKLFETSRGITSLHLWGAYLEVRRACVAGCWQKVVGDSSLSRVSARGYRCVMPAVWVVHVESVRDRHVTSFWCC